jgi:hypothetical protein
MAKAKTVGLGVAIWEDEDGKVHVSHGDPVVGRFRERLNPNDKLYAHFRELLRAYVKPKAAW